MEDSKNRKWARDPLKQHLVMGLDPPFQSCLQLREFPAASVPRANSTPRLRIAFSLDDRVDHALSTFAPDIRYHAGQFDIGCLQHGCRNRLIS